MLITLDTQHVRSGIVFFESLGSGPVPIHALSVVEDRERLDDREQDTTAGDGNEGLPPVRASTEQVARLEPGSGTLNVHSKQAGIDLRSTTENHPGGLISGKGALGEAQSITAEALGPKAKALAAQTESGAYRGSIIGETDQFIIQRQSSRFSVAHPKDLLDRQPRLDLREHEPVAIVIVTDVLVIQVRIHARERCALRFVPMIDDEDLTIGIL